MLPVAEGHFPAMKGVGNNNAIYQQHELLNKQICVITALAISRLTLSLKGEI